MLLKLFLSAVQHCFKKATAKTLSMFRNRQIGSRFALTYIMILLMMMTHEMTLPKAQTSFDYYEILESRQTEIRESAKFDTGINLTNIWNLDLSSKTFNAEGFVWMKWDALPDWLDEWDPEVNDDPPKGVGFVNAVERYDFVSEIEPSQPWIDSDGSYLQWLFFSGKFIARELDFKKFPFEQIQLPVEIEFDDFFSTEAVFQYEQDGSVIAGNSNLHGYRYDGNTVDVRAHVYPTGWGQAETQEQFGGSLSKYSNLTVNVSYVRNWQSSVLTVFLPLFVVMLVVVLTPLIRLEHYDAKVALPASVLLVLVFLQDSYRKMLPLGLEYPTFADYVFYLCMAATSIVFIWSVANTNLYLDVLSAKNDASFIRSRQRSEILFFRVTVLFVIISPIAMWFTVNFS